MVPVEGISLYLSLSSWWISGLGCGMTSWGSEDSNIESRFRSINHLIGGGGKYTNRRGGGEGQGSYPVDGRQSENKQECRCC